MDKAMSAEELAILHEVATLATVNAAEAFGMFSGSRLTVRRVTFEAVPLERITQMTPPGEIMVGIKLTQQDDTDGFLLALMGESDALALVSMLVGSSPTDLSCLDEMELSALCETGNILTASFFTALETHCGVNVLPGPPSIAIDFGEAVVVDALLPLAEQAGEVFVAHSDIIPADEETPFSASVQLLFSPTLPSWKKISEAYKANNDGTSSR